MYHYVYTPDDLPKTINTNYILDSKLEEQLKYLKEQDFYFPSYQELSAYIISKKYPVNTFYSWAFPRCLRRSAQCYKITLG